MKYYVLGSENNQMLEDYRERYYKKLIGDLLSLGEKIGKINKEYQNIIQEFIAVGEENKTFLLNGENSVIINFLYIEYVLNTKLGLEKKEIVLEKFMSELEVFLLGESEKLSMNTGAIIANTNIRLTMVDNNPYSVLDAHPDHENTGGVQGYGNKTETEWLEVYNKTFELLKQVDAGVWLELNTMISKIIPLGTAENVHNSSSYKECVGHLYMGYTISSNIPELNNLEAIIHESSHNKLNLILHFDEVILSDMSERFYSPYRPDARHIKGVFLGLHAFVPVVYILMKTYAKNILPLDEMWLEKITLYYIKNKFTYKVLKKHGKFTVLGQEILDEMYEVMQMTDILFAGLKVSSAIITKCKIRQVSHFKEVNSRYPYLEY